MRSKPIIACAAGASLALAGSALAGNGGVAPVAPASPNADAIRESYWFVSIFAGAIFLLVEGVLISFVVRYRRRRRPRSADGAQIHGSTRLELLWTLGPVLILSAIAVAVFAKLPELEDVPAAAAGEENLVVEITGVQYYWQFRYPNGVVAIDRLRAPEGRPVELRVTAPDWDVIHSWWIPALGGKTDAIPGTVNSTWFRADRGGVFEGQCAELCALYHAKMLAAVEVMPAETFDTWLAERREAQTAGTSQLGEEQYEGACAKCHGLAGEGGYGPLLEGNAIIGDARTLERLLREGRGLMPPVGRDWDDQQMRAMTEYLEERFADGG